MRGGGVEGGAGWEAEGLGGVGSVRGGGVEGGAGWEAEGLGKLIQSNTN